MASTDANTPVRRARSVQLRPHTPKLTHPQAIRSQNSPSTITQRSPSTLSRSVSDIKQRNSKLFTPANSNPSSPKPKPSSSASSVPVGPLSPSALTSPRNRVLNGDGNNIKVVARFRPENDGEKKGQHKNLLSFIDSTAASINNETFTFDRVFDSNATQADIFEYSVTQTVDDFFNGYNGAVLAYGQTGSGKSYTMMGSDINDSTLKGLIPRITDLVFQKIKKDDEDTEYTLSASYMEIYLEQIRDLLVDPKLSPVNLQVREDGISGVHVKNLSKAYISSAEELYAILKRGSDVRIKASTEMNEESSRSHAIVQINLNQENPQDGIKRSKLFLVDLAGSEKVSKTGVSGQGLEEAKKINSSLSALGNVINALTDSKSTHVPYRDSKLTRILQESLGGNSRTSLIVNCSPSSYNEAETLSTLRFGTRAKKIKNKAHVNSEPSKQDLLNRIEQLKRINEDQSLKATELECELELWKSGARRVEIESIVPKEDICVAKETQILPSPVSPISPIEEKNFRYLQDKVRQLTDLLAKAPNLSESPTPDRSVLQQLHESQEINRALMLDLEEKCLRLIELELKIDELEDKLKNPGSISELESSKLLALETTLEQFSIQMEELGIENDLLRKDVVTTRKIAETRNERIKTLELMVKDYQLQAAKENAKFENKFATLKKRISNARNASSTNQISPFLNPFDGNNYNNNDNGIFRITEDDPSFLNDKSFDSMESFNSTSSTLHSRKLSNGASSHSRKSSHESTKSFGGKVGLNLNIMKPLKGGSTVISE